MEDWSGLVFGLMICHQYPANHWGLLGILIYLYYKLRYCKGFFVVSEDNPANRLKLFRKRKGLTQSHLSSALGRSQSFIGQIESGRSLPSRDLLERLRNRYELNPDWLLTGEGEMLSPPVGFLGTSGKIAPPDHGQPMTGDLQYDGEEFAFVRRMDLDVSAGPGLAPVEGAEGEAIALSRSWLVRHGVAADLAVLVRVRGDSMEPTIPDGCLALVDISRRVVDAAGIYALSLGDDAFIKRLTPMGEHPRDGLLILSDNKAYEHQVVAGAALADLRIAGRVRAIFSDID